MVLDNDLKVKLLVTMLRVRRFEEQLRDLFLNNKIPGFTHVSLGQEAVAAGVCLALREDDYITSTHRGHGHCVAKGMDFRFMFAELMGKRNGFCRGKGGSMHVADFSKGILGANGIVGGGIPTATSSGLSAQIQQNGRVCACFFGDGAMAEGAFHESLNVAALWRLPVIYVCENNLYGEWTHYTRQHSVADLSSRGQAYGIASERVDGMDAQAVYLASLEATERARHGEGPTLLECVTYRYTGHSISGPPISRPEEEVRAAKERDPVEMLSRALISGGVLSEDDIKAYDKQIRAEVAEAVDFADKSEFPRPEEALKDLYV